MNVARLLLFVCMVLCLPFNAEAHSLRTGYLEITETGNGIMDAVWKAPSLEGRTINMSPEFPEDCEITVKAAQSVPAGGQIETWQLVCERSLLGREIAFHNLGPTQADILIRSSFAGTPAQTFRATASNPVISFAANSHSGSVFTTYFILGVEHILLGIDHLLFVLCLIFLIQGFRKLALTITSFTLAHSLTLAATTMGIVQLPIRPIEAIIAFSIVLLAVEVILSQRDETPRFSQRMPWIIAFTFGLLHGFGFASALQEIGLPDEAIPASLLAFNLGVEAGQLAFVGTMLIVLTLFRRVGWQRPVQIAATYSTGIIATKWLIERMF